jgi:hypothetical protein
VLHLIDLHIDAGDCGRGKTVPAAQIERHFDKRMRSPATRPGLERQFRTPEMRAQPIGKIVGRKGATGVKRVKPGPALQRGFEPRNPLSRQ